MSEILFLAGLILALPMLALYTIYFLASPKETKGMDIGAIWTLSPPSILMFIASAVAHHIGFTISGVIHQIGNLMKFIGL